MAEVSQVASKRTRESSATPTKSASRTAPNALSLPRHSQTLIRQPIRLFIMLALHEPKADKRARILDLPNHTQQLLPQAPVLNRLLVRRDPAVLQPLGNIPRIRNPINDIRRVGLDYDVLDAAGGPRPVAGPARRTPVPLAAVPDILHRGPDAADGCVELGTRARVRLAGGIGDAPGAILGDSRKVGVIAGAQVDAAGGLDGGRGAVSRAGAVDGHDEGVEVAHVAVAVRALVLDERAAHVVEVVREYFNVPGVGEVAALVFFGGKPSYRWVYGGYGGHLLAGNEVHSHGFAVADS